MKWYQKIIAKFAKWLQPKHKFINVEEFPNNVNEKTIYIVGDIKEPWLLAFSCPCGCHNLIQLNLLKEAKPRWKFQIVNKSKITISPSIWRTSGCKSHFFIHKSKIDWVRTYKPQKNSTPKQFLGK